MCGIVGIFSKREPVLVETLQRAVQSLHHRGPDAQKLWFSLDKSVGLGHARLSIIDLSTGDQPIPNEDGSVRIVVNGEFYGFEEIRRELEQRGHCLRTRSDSEIALHLYEDFGAQFVHSLRGEFAVILWDEARRRVMAVRDRFGIKPLFYAFWRDTLYIASEVKALFAAGVPARWDEEGVFHCLTSFGSHQARTLYDGVFQVPPGHFLLATDKHMQVTRYWDFDYPKRSSSETPRSDAEYAMEFREAFEEAVRIRLRADVPVGVYLSGGLDSCSVLGLAARHYPGPLRAFTLSFDHEQYDERPMAEEMAKYAGAEFHAIPIRQRELAENFEDAIAQAETLCVNGHGVAKFLLSRAVHDAGYKVVLTGEGSDEVLGGYPHFRRDVFLYNREGQDPASIERLLASLDANNPVSRGILMPDGEGVSLASVQRVLGFVPSWMETFATRTLKMRQFFSGEFIGRYGNVEGTYPMLDDADVRGQLACRDPLHQSLYLWSKTVMANYILTMLGDRMEMAHSIEGRVPFLDHKLVEKLVSMPVNQKIRGTTEKFVLREAVKDVITDTIYNREKHPFLSPPSTLNPNDALSVLVQDTLRGEALRSLPFFNHKSVVALLDRVPQMDTSTRTVVDQLLMGMVSVCVLHKRLGISSSDNTTMRPLEQPAVAV